MNPIARSVSIHPYFKVRPGKFEAAKAMLPKFVAATVNEQRVLYYEFTINGDVIFCREAYSGADGALAHLANVGALLDELLKMVDLIRLEIHGPAGELEKLKTAIGHFKPEWFVYECGMRG